MIIALTYGPLNDIDLFAWSPPDGGGAHEVALSFKHTLKITPLTKQRLFEDKLGLFLLGLDGQPLKISGAHQNLKTKTLYTGNYFPAFESSVLWISRFVQYFYRLFE